MQKGKCMKKVMISNKTEFRMFQYLKLLFLIILVVLFSLLTIKKLMGLETLHLSSDFLAGILILNFIISMAILIIERLKPTYIEFYVLNDEIIINTHISNPRSFKAIIDLFNYKNNMIEYRISRDEFTNYKLSIGKLGLRKELKLQKTNNNNVYESTGISLSLLGQKNYTNLILSIDKLCNKICLN